MKDLKKLRVILLSRTTQLLQPMMARNFVFIILMKDLKMDPFYWPCMDSLFGAIFTKE